MTRTVTTIAPTTFPIPVNNPDELEAAALAVAKLNAEPHIMFFWSADGDQSAEEVSDHRIARLADLLALIAQMDDPALDALRAVAEPIWARGVSRHGVTASPSEEDWPGLREWNDGQRRQARLSVE